MLGSALALAAALLAPAPGTAGDTDADLRCLAVTTYAVDKAEGETRSQLIAAALYFVGRIDARQPGYDYQAALTALLSDERRVRTLGDDAKRCGALLKDRGEMLQRVGAALQARARAAK